jgi:YggT family protein
MDALIDIIVYAAQAVNMLLIVWFVLGLLFAFNVIGRQNRFLWELNNSIRAFFEPVLGPIRRRLPDTGAVDFSPFILIIILFAIVRIVSGLR